MHRPPQFVVPAGHITVVPMHTPIRHVCPSEHTLPHAPQLLGSSCVLVQSPPQFVVPIGHMIIELAHIPS